MMIPDETAAEIARLKTAEPTLLNRDIAKRVGLTPRQVDAACNAHPLLTEWRAFTPTKKRRSPGTAPKPVRVEKPRVQLTDEQVELIRQWRADAVPKEVQAKRLGFTFRKYVKLVEEDVRLSPPDEPPPPPARNGAGGRRKKLTARDLHWLERWTGEGHGLVAVAAKLHVRLDRLKHAIKEDDDAREAYERGREIEERGLVDVLKRHGERGNVAGPIFLLKSRHGYREQGPQTTVNVDASDRRVQVVNMQAARSTDEWMKLVERFGGRLPGTLQEPDTELGPLERPATRGTPVLRLLRDNDDER
jgi:hypothetical protein